MCAASREPYTYDREDVTFLKMLANQVALAVDDALTYRALQESLALAQERLRNIETSERLLRSLTSVLDIRTVFPRISQISAMVLPHDLLTLTFHDGNGEVVIQAASHQWEPLPTRLRVEHLIPEGDGVAIVNDFETETCPAIQPADFWDRIRSAGYRSFMAIHLTARGQRFGVQFWSTRPGAFEESQLGIARRIADHVGLAVSHEQLAEAQRLAAEAELRAGRLEARVKSLSDQLASKRGRMVGPSPEWQAVLKAAVDAEVRGWKVSEEKNGWYVEQLKKNGMAIYKPSEQLTADLRRVGNVLLAEWQRKAGDEGKKVIEAYRKQQ